MAARRDRVQLIAEAMEHLLGPIDAAVARANSRVLFNPMQSPAVVKARNQVAADVHEFHELLGIESQRDLSDARPWREAAEEGWDKARATGEEGVDALKRLGSETRGQAKAVKDKLSGKLAERLHRRGEESE
jgi:hypothetical protein